MIFAVPIYRSESDHEHTAGPVRQRSRQHGRTYCSCSAAESDAVPRRSRQPCQTRIRDRSCPIAGLAALRIVWCSEICIRKDVGNTRTEQTA